MDFWKCIKMSLAGSRIKLGAFANDTGLLNLLMIWSGGP